MASDDAMAAESVWLNVVEADALRRERMMRSLRDDLEGEGWQVRLVRSGIAEAVGAKGLVESSALIVVAAAPWARPVATVLSSTLTAWIARDRRARVRVSRGDRTIELTGDPTEDQQVFVRELLDPDHDKDSQRGEP